MERSIYYLSSLVNDWHQLVQKVAHDCSWLDTINSPPISPPISSKKFISMNETFMSSFQSEYLPSQFTGSSSDEEQALQKDDFIDIGEACNMIFQVLVGFLRHESDIGMLVEKTSVFLKFYLDSCPKATPKDYHDLSRYIFSYFYTIMSQVHSPSSSYFVESVEIQLMAMAFNLLDYLSKLLPVIDLCVST